MVASIKTRRVVCYVVRVAENPQSELPQDTLRSRQNQLRPSRQLPWSDPEIVNLVSRLQQEVRQQRRTGNQDASIKSADDAKHWRQLHCDLEPPCPWEDDWSADDSPRPRVDFDDYDR